MSQPAPRYDSETYLKREGHLGDRMLPGLPENATCYEEGSALVIDEITD